MFPKLPVFEMLSARRGWLPCSALLCSQFHMSYADQERYENEERPEVQRQILAEIARKLPVYTRTGNGGELSTELLAPSSKGCHSEDPTAFPGTHQLLLSLCSQGTQKKPWTLLWSVVPGAAFEKQDGFTVQKATCAVFRNSNRITKSVMIFT